MTVFNREKARADGLQRYCRECQADVAAVWRVTRRDDDLQRKLDWYYDNSERSQSVTRVWKKNNPEAVAEHDRRKHTKRRMAVQECYIEHVDRLVVLEMMDGICGICGMDVDPLDYHVDHIVPLSRGGTHCYANVQPAHPLCNARKGVR